MKFNQRHHTLVLIVTLILLAAAIPLAAQDVTPIIENTPLPPTEGLEEAAAEVVDLAVGSAEGAASALDDLIRRLTATPQSDLARLVLIIGGVVLLVAGWRVYDFIVIIAGLLIGAMVAASLVTTDNAVILLAALLIGGLIGAAVAYFLYYVAVFLIGAYIGILLTNALAAALSLTPVSALVLLIGGLVGGLVLIGLSFEFLVLLSALVGAQMLALGLGLEVIWTLIFAVVGVIIQFALMRSFRYDFRRRRRPITPFRRTAP